jgi:hypothetical protein
MGLHKGQTNNKDGRPKGTPNKMTKELRIVLKNVIAKELENIPENLDKLEPKERMEMIVKLIPYVLPKIETISMDRGEPESWGF